MNASDEFFKGINRIIDKHLIDRTLRENDTLSEQYLNEASDYIKNYDTSKH